MFGVRLRWIVLFILLWVLAAIVYFSILKPWEFGIGRI